MVVLLSLSGEAWPPCITQCVKPGLKRRRKFWVQVGPPKTFGHNMHSSILSRRAAVTEISIKKAPKIWGENT